MSSYPYLDIGPVMGRIKLQFDSNHYLKSFWIRFKNFANRFLEAAIRFCSIRNFGGWIYPNARFMLKRDAVNILARLRIVC